MSPARALSAEAGSIDCSVRKRPPRSSPGLPCRGALTGTRAFAGYEASVAADHAAGVVSNVHAVVFSGSYAFSAAYVSRSFAHGDGPICDLRNQVACTMIYFDEGRIVHPVLAEIFDNFLSPGKVFAANAWSAQWPAAQDGVESPVQSP